MLNPENWKRFIVWLLFGNNEEQADEAEEERLDEH